MVLPVRQEAFVAKSQADVTQNDSDKSFTVPTGLRWKITSLWVTLTTTATVGDRQIAVEVQDGGGNVFWRVEASTTQAASLTRDFLFSPQAHNIIPLSDLPPGFVLRVYDSALVDPTADDMTVRILYGEAKAFA